MGAEPLLTKFISHVPSLSLILYIHLDTNVRSKRVYSAMEMSKVLICNELKLVTLFNQNYCLVLIWLQETYKVDSESTVGGVKKQGWVFFVVVC